MRKERLKTLLESRMNSTAFNDIFSKEEQERVINLITNHTKKFLNHQIVVRPSMAKKVCILERTSTGRLFVQVPIKKWDNFQDMVSVKYHLCKGSIGLSKAYSLEINSDDFMTITNKNYEQQ